MHTISRRGFLGAILGAAAAPAIVKAESLMKIVVPKPVELVLAPVDEIPFFEVGKIEDVRFIEDKYQYAGTVTGRWSSHYPNLQELPRPLPPGFEQRMSRIRRQNQQELFAHTLDYSDLETRVLALDEKKRQIIKSARFAERYGMGPDRLKELFERKA